MSTEKITDKAKDIEFVSSSASNPRLRRSMVQPAVLTQVMESESPMARELRALKDQVDVLTVTTVEWRDKSNKFESQTVELEEKLDSFDGSNIAKRIDPHLIKPSQWANRSEQSFENQEFNELVLEIESAGGNVQPIKVRPIVASSPQMYEIVFGHRRHRACLKLVIPVLAMIESLDDKALFVEMDRENRKRADLRPYDQGLTYARALELKLYSSNKKMADALGVDVGGIGKLLALVRLPIEIIDAFESPLDIQFSWGPILAKSLELDRDAVIARAIEIGNRQQKLKAASVFQHLTKIEKGGVDSVYPDAPKSLSILGKSGSKAKVAFNPKKKTYEVSLSGVGSERMSELEKLVKAFLDR